MRTQKILSAAVLAICLFVFAVLTVERDGRIPEQPVQEKPVAAASTSAISQTSHVETAKIPVAPPPANKPAPPPPVLSPTVSATTTPLTSVSLVIESVRYSVPVHEGENVFDIMSALKSEGSITFTTREYAGMGMMLLSINGKPSNGDVTWIFYVNGKESQKGVSSVGVSPGDVIEWKYEKAY